MFDESDISETEQQPAKKSKTRSSGSRGSYFTRSRNRSYCGSRYCGVINCSSCNFSCPTLLFFKLPLHLDEPDRRREWLKQIGRTEMQPYQRLFVCEKHFEPKDIYGTPKVNPRRHRLKKNAVPTLLLPPPMPGPPIKPKYVYRRTNTSAHKVYQAHTKTYNEGTSTTNKMASTENDSNNTELSHPSSLYNTQTNEAHQTTNISENKVYQTHTNTYNEGPITTNEIASTENDSKNIELNHPSPLYNTQTNEALDSFNKLYLKFKDNTESSSKIYSDQYKLRILQLYYGNTKAYEVLQSTLCLPPISTLPSFIPSTLDGINENYLNGLKVKIDTMSLHQKYGILCVDIMEIKPYVHYDYRLDSITGIIAGSNGCLPVRYAFVAMVRGITTDWHQIVSIYLTAALECPMLKGFNTWIDTLIKDLIQLGITIKAVVTSTDNFFINAFALKNMLQQKPFFIVNDKRVYHVFDPLHLMLLLYNELKCDMVLYRNAKWEDIAKFYDEDSERRFRLARGSSSINHDDLQQNKLKAAAQILSLSTASGISTFVDMELLEKTAMDTADFIVRINKVFTSLYPDAFPPEYKQAQAAHLWNNNISFLRCVNMPYSNIFGTEVKSKVRFIKCFITSMESVLLMQKDSTLKDHASVLTRFLNLDPLVEFIDKIHLDHKQPTCNELFKCLKDDFIFNNFLKMEESEENVTRMDDFIVNVNKIIELENCFVEPVNKTMDIRSYESYNEDYTQLEDAYDASSIFYVAIYLLDKMCQKYKNSVSTRIKLMNSSVCYESRKDDLSGSVVIPDNEFLQFVHNMDEVFFYNFKKSMVSGKLFEELMKRMGNFPISIDKGPLEYITSLFIDMRVIHTVKYNNDLYERDHSNADQFYMRKLSSVDPRPRQTKHTYVNLAKNPNKRTLNF